MNLAFSVSLFSSSRPRGGRPAQPSRLRAVAARALRRGATAALLFAGLATRALAAPPSPPVDPEKFPLPPQLEANVLFWTDIYSKYTSHEVVIHDNLYMNVVYTSLDFSELDRQDVSDRYKDDVRSDSIRKAMHTYEEILRDLAQTSGPHETSPAERREVEAMFRNIPGGESKYTAAIDRIHSQAGLKDRMEAAIRRSGRYMPTLERIFRARGLPVELTRLPFVESMFQDRARSKVGAGGIWQFMPGTARNYLRMRRELDERWDPFAASDGAARLLGDNYDLLQTWPLALTAYNHGAAGMARAASQLGTKDLGVIAWNYDSPSFGFASRNFYSEFLAAVSVYASRSVYFPTTEPDPPLGFDELVVGRPVSIRVLAQRTATDMDTLEDLNLGLTPQVIAGRLPLPAGYRLRVPAGARATFQTALNNTPAAGSTTAQGRPRSHQVAKGETAAAIASRYGITTGSLLAANGLSPSATLKAGQRLRVPAAPADAALDDDDDAAPPPKPASPPDAPRLVAKSGAASSAPAPTRPADAAAVAAPAVHVVKAGDTLFEIASANNVSVTDLEAANGIRDASSLRPGQTLRLSGNLPDTTRTSPVVPETAIGSATGRPPAPPPAARPLAAPSSTHKPVTHKVRRGETLNEIAARYGTTVAELKKENRLRGQLIQPNQVLRVPAD